MEKLKTFVFSRVHERSTWRGLVMIATALGATLTPEQAEAIIVAGIAGSGLIGAFTADQK